MIIAVTVCSLSRAAAEKVTGEVTVAPLAGEQIWTVLSTVAVHAAEATFAEARRRVAASKARNEIIWGSRGSEEIRLEQKMPPGTWMRGIAPPAQAQIVHVQ
jgi:methyl coenzyme M reductase subunit C-like uncharacterized protein (methanogenesis marker protein 7)